MFREQVSTLSEIVMYGQLLVRQDRVWKRSHGHEDNCPGINHNPRRISFGIYIGFGIIFCGKWSLENVYEPLSLGHCLWEVVWGSHLGRNEEVCGRQRQYSITSGRTSEEIQNFKPDVNHDSLVLSVCLRPPPQGMLNQDKKATVSTHSSIASRSPSIITFSHSVRLHPLKSPSRAQFPAASHPYRLHSPSP